MERQSYYLTIKDCLCNAPYACAYILLGLAEVPAHPGPLDREWHQLKDESQEEKLISLQLCNNAITDDVLHAYIQNWGADKILFEFNEHISLYLERQREDNEKSEAYNTQ